MVIAVIQARMGSTRLPGKVLRPLAGRPVLDWVVRAAGEAIQLGNVVVATTMLDEDEDVAALAEESGAHAFRGSTEDVLERFVGAVDDHRGPIVRLTGDCPLLDPRVIAMAVAAFEAGDEEYLSTTSPRSLPRGLDVEVFSNGALLRAHHEADGPDRAHVTSWLYREPGRARTAGLTFQPQADDLRVTLDTEEDALALDAIVDELGDRAPAWRDLVGLLRSRPDIVALNADVRQKSLDQG